MDFPSALLNRNAVKFSISIEPENDADYNKHFDDFENVKWIDKELASGNDWAWCRVKVTARLEEYDIEEYNYLGSCSYKDEEDFKKGGYYESMADDAFLLLNEKVSQILTSTQKLVKFY